MHIEISDVEILDISTHQPSSVTDYTKISFPVTTSPVLVTLSNGVNYTGNLVRGTIATSNDYSLATIELADGTDTIVIMGRIYLDSRQWLRQTS